MVLVVMYSACVFGHRFSRSSSSGPSARRERERGCFVSRSIRSRRIYAPQSRTVARRPISAVRRRARANGNPSEWKETRVSETFIRRARAKTAKRPSPSLVGFRLGSVSRLRQLITIGELSTELCLSCVRDITADARRSTRARVRRPLSRSSQD